MDDTSSSSLDIAGLRSLIDDSMKLDQHRLNQLLERIERARAEGKPYDRNLRKLEQTASASSRLRQRRQQRVPAIEYPSDLPVSAQANEIAAAIRDHQVIVVCGETGSGKSTQLPKICLESGRGVAGLIGHTQPRRIAARTIAARISEELGTPPGQHVGYQIRFTDTTQPETLIKLMTDGILLAETRHDRFLERYDTLIIDEAHERSLNIDFLLGYIRRLLPRRPDLRVIITSATIDAERFAGHFGTPQSAAPIIEVSGRTYPVEIVYRPVETTEEDEREPDWMAAIVEAVDELARIDHGHILIFMPTERDIHELMKLLRGHSIPGDRAGQQTEILPLYARLTNADQNRVYQPRNYRRIVVTTNVAESSLTVPGIRYVIDSGTARISRYSARSGIQRLPIEPISQASANQRAGRCGRVSDGICIRLYSEQDFCSREPFTVPEIQRTNLASVILQTISLRLGKLDEFPFLDPPRPTAVQAGYKALHELGAINDRQELTRIGQQLSQLPVDPRIGRMILAAHDEACLHEVLIIASALELRDPRDRPFEKREAADQAHAEFQDENSDFLTYLKLWDFYHEQKEKLSRSQLRKACQRRFLSYNRLREWTDVFRQLRQLVEQNGMKVTARRDDSDAIHQALLTGMLGNVAFLPEGNEYSVAGGGKALLWPGSGLSGKKPKWAMCAEVVETNRRYLRTAARIRPDWIEPAAAHLVQKHQGDAYWSAKRGAAVADERVTLFGLTIVPRRQITLASSNPEKARELLIWHGLVENDWEFEFEFLKHNRHLKDQLEQRQARSRQHDLLRGEEAEVEFYEQRLPKDICDAHRLKRWLRQQRGQGKSPLIMEEADLLSRSRDPELERRFPDAIQIADSRFQLDYHLEPGTEDDGITIQVPAAGLQQLKQGQLGWLVPGLLEEKITALIKSLPKDLRRALIPAPDTAREVVREIRYGQGDMETEVARILSRIAGEPIPPGLFRVDQLPRHLKMNVRVVDEAGTTLASGRELAELQKELVSAIPPTAPRVTEYEWMKAGLKQWDFESLPESVTYEQHGVQITVFPTLRDREDHVDVEAIENKPLARREHLRGLRRLFVIESHRQIRQQVAWLPQLDRLQLLASSIRPLHPLREQLVVLLADRACFRLKAPLPRSPSEYREWLERSQNQLSVAVQDVAAILLPLFETCHATRLTLEKIPHSAFAESQTDMQRQLTELISPRFLEETPWVWLQHYPRYLKALNVRAQKLNRSTAPRDVELARQLQSYRARIEQREAELTARRLFDPELEYFRWMVEEYRVSLFAQELRTTIKVSDTRLEKQWSKVQAIT